VKLKNVRDRPATRTTSDAGVPATHRADAPRTDGTPADAQIRERLLRRFSYISHAEEEPAAFHQLTARVVSKRSLRQFGCGVEDAILLEPSHCSDNNR
jgi:hypothetical protein